MSGDTYIDPSRDHFEAFKALPRDKPIHMLNLLRFNERANYPAGHPDADRGLSGAEAYGLYGKASAPVFERVGGSIIWRGKMETMVIGPNDKQWDLAFIAHYPTGGAFLEMVTDPDYKIAVVHRQAAVLTSRLIRFAPVAIDGISFA